MGPQQINHNAKSSVCVCVFTLHTVGSENAAVLSNTNRQIGTGSVSQHTHIHMQGVNDCMLSQRNRHR